MMLKKGDSKATEAGNPSRQGERTKPPNRSPSSKRPQFPRDTQVHYRVH